MLHSGKSTWFSAEAPSLGICIGKKYDMKVKCEFEKDSLLARHGVRLRGVDVGGQDLLQGLPLGHPKTKKRGEK